MPVRLPSLGDVLAAAYATLRRFPLVLAAGVVATVSAILTAEDIGPDTLHDRLLAAASLGIPLLTALALVARRKARAGLAHAMLGAGGIVVLGFVYALWPGWSEQERFFRYTQLALAFHLLVAFLPLWGRPAGNAFWQYNRALLERFLTAGVFSGTLFVGLALALAALDKLFGVDVPESAYFRIWVLLAFVFNTWFFLGGVPEDLDALEERRDYPASLRVFAQYTLVPLVSVYLVILTLYLGKVVVTWDWPTGWIGWLVSGVATTGILTLLLVHPVADDPAQRWVVAFARSFWLAVLPALVMLWLALWQRVRQYGITEPRYFLLVLSLWLAGLALYYSITRSRQIRIIPISLCAVALLVFAGPWGAYDVAERSQVGRLRALLERNGRLVEGRLRRAGPAITWDDERQISAVVSFLTERDRAAAIAPWFRDSTDVRLAFMMRAASRATGGPEYRARIIVEAMGVTFRDPGETNERGAVFTYTAVRGTIPVRGYDVLLTIRADSTALRDSGLVAFASRADRSVRVLHNGALLLTIPIDSALAHAEGVRRRQRQRAVPRDTLRIVAENASARAVVYLSQINGTDSAGTRRLTVIAGDVLVGLKP